MAEDLVLKLLQEMRADARRSDEQASDHFGKLYHRLGLVEAEAKEFRQETRENFGKVFHRLAALENQMSDVRSRLGSLIGGGKGMRPAKLFALAAGLAFAAAAHAQSWPQKPVKFIVPFAPGGATDISARLLGQKLSEAWGQSVVIENRAGAGGGVGAAEAARATPDGYTLFFPSGSVVTANQHIYAQMNYNPEKDFVPVTKVVSGPQVLVVQAGSPYKSVKELIDAARAQPGKLTFGHAGIGTQTHLAAENFVSSAKIETVAVPYKGEGPALTGLVGGDTTFAVTNVAATIGHISSGRLRALGVTSKTEFPQLPGVPPIAKTLPGFENSGWFGIVAPTGTPKEIIQKVYRDSKKALESTELRARLYVQGLAPVGDTPEEMGRAMKEETQLWARVVRERKIQVK